MNLQFAQLKFFLNREFTVAAKLSGILSFIVHHMRLKFDAPVLRFQVLLIIFFGHFDVKKVIVDEENELMILWTCEFNFAPVLAMILVCFAILWLPVYWIAACCDFERDIDGDDLFPDVIMRDIFNYFCSKSRT